jgi:1,4-alpha-glucan branching enzyme
MTRDRGQLCIVLHAHMPYVEGFDTWPFGEEWLWEALASVYLPLIDALDGLPVTFEPSPVLCDQLECVAGAAGERFQTFVRDLRIGLSQQQADRFRREGRSELADELMRSAASYEAASDVFERIGGDVLGSFKALGANGPAELWTSAATHALLPLVATGPGLRLQIGSGIAAHRGRFDDWSGGFWLPECAFAPGIEQTLSHYGVSAFCVDQTGRPGWEGFNQLEPVETEHGLVAVPLDWETIGLVWDSKRGYPSHPAYRDYHARTDFDFQVWDNQGRPYSHRLACEVAEQHARDFVEHTISRLDAYRQERGRPGLVCAGFDAELFGHWWYEGINWLTCVFEQARLQGLRISCVSDALEQVGWVRSRSLHASSWGAKRDFSTWDSPGVADLAFALRRAELAVTTQASGATDALERAARELLAAQASDWTFLITNELAGDYPRRRIAQHLQALDASVKALKDCDPVACASLRNLAPSLDLTAFEAA